MHSSRPAVAALLVKRTAGELQPCGRGLKNATNLLTFHAAMARIEVSPRFRVNPRELRF
jgi:hypothetical protein